MHNDSSLSKDGSWHITDERINTISHLVAACFALMGSVLLITLSIVHHDMWKVTGFTIYGVSLLCLFIFSTLHHGLSGGKRASEVMRTFDYISVFLLIAGTVTPLVFVYYRDLFGWIVFSVVWAIAILGIILRSIFRKLPKYVTNTLYISLGWLPVILIVLENRLSPGGLLLLAAGGVTYSAGLVIFAMERPNPLPGRFGFHEIWHLMVVAAATLHFLFMYFYVL